MSSPEYLPPIAARGAHDTQEAPQGASSDLRCIEGGGEKEPIPYQWPDFEFSISEQSMFGGALATTEDARGHAIVKAVQETALGSLPEMQGNSYRTVLAESKKQKNRKWTLGGKTYVASEAIDLQYIVQAMQTPLIEENHPLIQAVHAVMGENDERARANANLSEGNRKPVISEWEMDNLVESLVVAAFPETYKQAIDAAIKHHKLTYKLLPPMLQWMSRALTIRNKTP